MVGGCQTFTGDKSERYHAGDSFNILAGWWDLDVITWTYIRSKEDFLCFRMVQPEIILGRPVADMFYTVSQKIITFKLSVHLSNLNRFSKFLHCWKAYEICYKSHTTLPTSP